MKIVIKEPNPFFSYQDEKFFFEWLQEIPVIKSVTGTSAGLEVIMDNNIDEPNLRDLLALFKRYNISSSPLIELPLNCHYSWLKQPDAFWYNDLFGNQESKRSRDRAEGEIEERKPRRF